ncbi:hypothetical protein JAAARDRAFT_204343 [Jaapia argillacea MUCL 33604]|uniref:Potassium transporter n=1 Tax=Jaapia argillacea MUCL 33604 TaxID=933084 RepID=A0A067QHB1_9AGAM|nr:hypothetical protein JAAARDRAFT_204343 [Jaapia argillacea MUCL 33604]
MLENGGHRTAPRATGLDLLLLSFQTLGIIYSDIGTSPLYVLNGIWSPTGPIPPAEDVIGGVSAILWSLTIIPLIKYVFICLRFGTREGEGGTFALFQGLFPPKDRDPGYDRTLTGDSVIAGSKFSSSAKLPSRFRWPLLVWCLLGTSLTLADGIFTPAVSVTSAVSGIAVALPAASSRVVPISIAFLVALFLSQPFGTSRLASVFAPVTCVWFLLLGATGIVNILSYPGIFRAFDPSRAILLFVRTGEYDLLAGVLLAVTGCEALFANLGQFNMFSIQLSFTFFVYPSLCLAYLGQGARLIADRDAVISNLFYKTIPGPSQGALFWILYVFAILATLIASQAMISATSSLVQQMINMKSLPPIRMVHTSERLQGRIYIPAVNWLLMIATVVVVAAFGSSTALTNAYGFAVATVMFSTTVLIAIQMRFVKRWPVFIAVLYFVVYGFFDGLFWGAAIEKIPHGAWVPLMIGIVLMATILFWTWAKGLEDDFDAANLKTLRHFLTSESGGKLYLRNDTPLPAPMPSDEVVENGGGTDTDRSEEGEESTELADLPQRELARIPTFAIFHKLTGGRGVPHSFIGFVRQWPAVPDVVVFLSVRVLPTARTDPSDRYVVDKVRTVEGFYGVTYYLGFREDFGVKVEEIVDHICALERRIDPRNSAARITKVKRAVATSTHIVPHYYVMSQPVASGKLSRVINWIRGWLIEDLYRPLSTMFPETENWTGPADEIIRVGVNAFI